MRESMNRAAVVARASLMNVLLDKLEVEITLYPLRVGQHPIIA